jgi:hypothetical protein
VRLYPTIGTGTPILRLSNIRDSGWCRPGAVVTCNLHEDGAPGHADRLVQRGERAATSGDFDQDGPAGQGGQQSSGGGEVLRLARVAM